MALPETFDKSINVQDGHNFNEATHSLPLQQATVVLIEVLLEVLDDSDFKDQIDSLSTKNIER